MRSAIACLVLFSMLSKAPLAESQTTLGVDCSLHPDKPAAGLTSPVRPVAEGPWEVENYFGNLLRDEDLDGLGEGTWHHTGEDYLVNRRSIDSQNKEVYAVDNGVVVFSTNGGYNPKDYRGGLVLIKHVAPAGTRFEIPAYRKVLEYGEVPMATISYPREFVGEIVSYYLHLGDAYVRQGDSVSRGQVIGRTYSYEEKARMGYAFVPHLHFEIWRKCTNVERNGYDPLVGTAFQEAAIHQIVDPREFIDANLPEGNLVRMVPFGIPLSGNVQLVGAGFGDLAGSVKVRGQLLFSSSPREWYVPVSGWTDTEIRFNLFQDPLFSSSLLVEPLHFEITRKGGYKEGDLYYPFKDVKPEDWFSQSLTSLWKDGLAHGFKGSGHFFPDDSIRRSEFVGMLVQSLCSKGGDTCPDSSVPPGYSDVSPLDWFYEHVRTAWNLGWLDHAHSGFRPNDSISRAEAAKIIAIAIGIPLRTPARSHYSDVATTDWFAPHVIGLTGLGVLKGYADATFQPGADITRAEAANIINSIRPKSNG